MKYSIADVKEKSAVNILGYVARAMKNEGLKDQIPEMKDKALTGGFAHMISVCVEYLNMVNEKVK